MTTSSNLWKRLRDINPAPPLQIGTVAATTPAGVVVTLLGGAQITVRGSASTGAKVFVRDGVLEGEAPSLTEVQINV